MRVGNTDKNSNLYRQGYKAFVVWDDNSRSYYKNRDIALSEIRKESGRRNTRKNK